MRFFLVDKVLSIEPGQSITGIKNVTLSEAFIHDHFPDLPIFPGTLILEALAQLSGFLIESTVNLENTPIRRSVLGHIEKAKFHRPAKPGDQLLLKSKILSTLENAAQVEVEANLNGERSAHAILTFVLKSIDSEKIHEQRRSLYRLWTQDLTLSFPIL